jgi:hypothetical protein
VAVLVTVKVTVTIMPVLAGFGVILVIVTVGAVGAETTSEVVPGVVDPLLSVAVTVIVKDPPEV